MTTALIIVDIQRDYFPGGKMELAGAEEAGRNAGRLLNAVRAANLPVVHVQHHSTRPNATFFIPGSEGVEIHSCVAPRNGELVITKLFPNSFRETGLQEHLAGLGATRLLICGMMTQMCIDATVRAAFDLGYECTVAHDACATRTLNFNGVEAPAAQVQAAFLAALAAVYAKVQAVEEILAAI